MAAAAADVVLMSNNLLKLPATLELCQLARRIIILNCTFAVGVKVIAVILALTGKLPLWAAILFDVGTLLVVTAVGTFPLASSAYSQTTAEATGKKIQDGGPIELSIVVNDSRRWGHGRETIPLLSAEQGRALGGVPGSWSYRGY
jgi:hypothetical protein